MIKNLLALTLVVFSIGLVNISAQTEGNIKTITKGVVNGLAINLPKPVFPAAAKAVGASGAVNVQVVIDENGDVISATAVSGHPLLRQASEKAAQAAKFKPIMLGGEAVRAKGVIVYNFVAPATKEINTAPEQFQQSRTESGIVVGSSSDMKRTGGVLNYSAVNLPKPAYPPAARAVKAQGVVNVQVLIDEQGNVATAEAVSGHPLLRAAAVEAALAAKFKTTLLSGQPVKVSGIVVYNFVP